MLDRFLKQFGKQNGKKREDGVPQSAESVPVSPYLEEGEGIEPSKNPEREIREKPVKSPNEATTIVFANSKGGVGKSTVAFVSCLKLALEKPDFLIEFIDLDRQGTTSESLHRFANEKFRLVSDPEFLLASGGVNNARIYQHLKSGFQLKSENEKRFVFFDTPAGTTPTEYSFMLDADYLLVPTSASDADLGATKKFLGRLYDANPLITGEKIKFLPTVVVIPNLLEDRTEILTIYRNLREFPCFLGHPIFYSRVFRTTFNYGISDHNVVDLLRITEDFGDWLVNIVCDHSLTSYTPSTLHQI